MDLCQKLCTRLWHLPTIQDKLNTISTGLHTHRGHTNYTSLCTFFDGPHHRSSPCWQIWLHLGHGRPRPFEGGNFIILQQNDYIRRHCHTTFGRPIQTIWITGQNHFWSRTPIYIKSLYRTSKTPRDQIGTIDSLPSPNRWKTEWVNQEIKAYLSIYCTSHPEDWPKTLHLMEFTHNNRQHADRQTTPFELMLRELPRAIPLTFENTKYPTIEEQMKALLRNREEALASHELARSRMTDRRKSTFVPFKKGDKVWLNSRNLKTIYHKKMKPKREGPFTITEVLGPVMYRLQLPTSWQIHNVFHAVLLHPYQENEVYGTNFTKPPPESIERDEVYEVESILKHWKWGRGYQYYIKWKGYPISDASWEPEHIFSDDGNMLVQYKRCHHL